MAYAPIAFTLPQYEDYPNWWMKAYEQGTTTPLSIATDATGGTLAAKIELNVDGFPVTAGAVRFIPFINGDYDLWLFPTAAEADANDTTNAIQLADNINADPTEGSDIRHGVVVKSRDSMVSVSPVDPNNNSVDLQPGVIVSTLGTSAQGDGGWFIYLVKTAAQAALDGDVIDDVDTNFTLNNGNVAILQLRQADHVTYDNVTSGLSATDVQAAVDELAVSVSAGTESIISGRFNNYLNTAAGQNALYIVGDSISEGANAVNLVNDSYAGIIRAAFQRKFNNRNYGFVNSRDLSGFGNTQFHTVSKTGFGADQFDGSYFGGTYINSTTPGGFVDFTYQGKDCKIVYEIQAGGGIFDILVDGLAFGAVDTSSGTPSKTAISGLITASTVGTHTVRIIKRADANPVNIMGMMYFDDASDNTPVVHNVGRSSIQASEIDDTILDFYAQTATAVLALGVNDDLLAASTTTFRAKISRFLDGITTPDGACIVCDFIFSKPSTNAYKTILREEVEARNSRNVKLLDFAELWFANDTINKFGGLLDTDGVHPTEHGHQAIAEAILDAMGMPTSKGDVIPIDDKEWNRPTFQNGWGNFGGGYNNTGYYKDKDGFVHIRGVVSGGTAVVNTPIFTLPVEAKGTYRPAGTNIFPIVSNNAFGIVEIRTTGEVMFMLGTNASFTLDGIKFKTN